MLKKFCPHSGCKILIDQSAKSCELHKGYYDKTVRKSIDNKQYDDFYHSTGWEASRMRAIVRDNGLCVECLKVKSITPYHTVHHIIPIKTPEGWRRRYDLDNLICLCEKHHQIAEQKARGA